MNMLDKESKLNVQPRMVHIYSIEILDDSLEIYGETVTFRFRVACSKGTYIRTLAVMIGEALGFPAHMSDLSRIKSANFTLSDCFTLEEIESQNGRWHNNRYSLSD